MEGNYGHFSSKSTNDRVFGVVRLVSKLNTACTMFCVCIAVIWALKRRNISSWKEATEIFRHNRRMNMFCELMGLCRSIIRRGLCSASKMQSCGRLHDEISQTGRKLRSFIVQIVEFSRFACCVRLVSTLESACTVFCT
jgi:hypothetical protein